MITATVPTQPAILARNQKSLVADAAEASLAIKERTASISNAGKLTHSMYSIRMSLALAPIASVSLKITYLLEESNFAQVL